MQTVYRAFLFDQSCGEKSVLMTCAQTSNVVNFAPTFTTRPHKYLAVKTEYGAKRNSISPSTSVFDTNFAWRHWNFFFVWPRWSSCKANRIGNQSPQMRRFHFLTSTFCQRSYQNAPQDAGICFVATMDEAHRGVHIQRCCQETWNAVTLSKLEKILALIAESTTTPCAAIS